MAHGAVIYIHGLGGSAGEADRFAPLSGGRDVIGFDYKAATPWDARDEFARFFDTVREKYGAVAVIANSIGAFFAMHALFDRPVERAFFISPVADMERLIARMMARAGVTENELAARGEIVTPTGETLSWEYLRWVRGHPIGWRAPTEILYGGNDALIPRGDVEALARRIGAKLTVMAHGEHWFRTDEQLRFLDGWLAGKL